MELNAVNGLGLVSNGSELGVLSFTNGVETLGEVAELITVGHPHGHGILETVEQLIHMASEASGLQVGVTVFTRGTGDDVIGVETVGNLLETVADSQNRDTQLEEGGVNVGGALLVDGVGTSREDDTLGLPGQLGELLGTREHLRVDIDLSEATGDQVGVLATKVQAKVRRRGAVL